MKINRLKVNGFRSLVDFEVIFETDMTVLVGENDSGKSSVLDCLEIITQGKQVESDDFNFDYDQIDLEIEIENFIYKKTFEIDKKENKVNENPLNAYPSQEYIENIKKYLEDADIGLEEVKEEIKEIARLLGLRVQSNSNIDTLKNNILSEFEKDNHKIENARFPKFNNVPLDGKHFEDVTSFFKRVFLIEKQNDIWNEKIDNGSTIDDFIRNRIDEYSSDITKRLNDTGIKDKIKMFLADLTDIQITPIYKQANMNIDAKVEFLENEQPINLQKKGDGTKRRITMALLEFKKEEDLLENDETTIYLLDEPDTHLHVKAQVELLDTFKGFTENGDQVIIATHSPFLLNSINPNQIRLIWLNQDNNSISQVRKLKKDTEITSNVLESLGIENIYLFFARTLIIVEGESEENFIKNYYFRFRNKTMSSNLIKIIDATGIKNVYGFAQGINELHDNNNIYVVHDNDPSEDFVELINRLGIDPAHIFILGENEFEDAFSDEVLFYTWNHYYSDKGKKCPETWTINEIRNVRDSCKKNEEMKFSSELKKLNARGIKMTKPSFCTSMAQYIEFEHLPDKLNDLFKVLD